MPDSETKFLELAHLAHDKYTLIVASSLSKGFDLHMFLLLLHYSQHIFSMLPKVYVLNVNVDIAIR